MTGNFDEIIIYFLRYNIINILELILLNELVIDDVKEYLDKLLKVLFELEIESKEL